MAQKRYLDLKDGVEIYKKSKAYVLGLKGANNGLAELGADGKVPSSQLPAFVDDVIDSYIVSGSTALSAGWLSASAGGAAFTPETGKIYVVLTAGDYQNKTYRWSGSTYVEISESLALGETSSTAYRGDRGATAYAHATDASRLTTAQSSGLYKIAVTAEGHVASVTAVVKADLTGLGVEDASNKVTSVRSASEATDTAYASEKAVRTELDKKANILPMSGTGAATENHLVAVSSTGDIKDSGESVQTLKSFATSAAGDAEAAAIAADEHIAYDSTNKQLTKAVGSGSASALVSAATIVTDGGGEKTANKTTTIRTATSGAEAADDTKYPTEKAVRTELNKKADKVANAINGHIATLDSNGNLADGGKSVSDLQAETAVGASATATGDASVDVTDPYLVFVQGSSAQSAHKFKGGSNISVKWDATAEAIVIASTYTPEAHYQAKNVVGASASAKANAAATNGNVYLNLVENDTVRSANKIVGDGDMIEVTSDANGVISVAGKTATAVQMAAAIDAYDNGYDGETGDDAVDAYIASLDA